MDLRFDNEWIDKNPRKASFRFYVIGIITGFLGGWLFVLSLKG